MSASKNLLITTTGACIVYSVELFQDAVNNGLSDRQRLRKFSSACRGQEITLVDVGEVSLIFH